MNDNENLPKKTCEVCEGSGQICSFKGVSRFVLTWEDCPVCGGIGFTTLEADMEKTTLMPKKDEKE
jgi:DnaJ-class molecular chaperone